jgi:hypothetical protein
MRCVDISMMLSTTRRAAPFSYAELPQSTRTGACAAVRASTTRPGFIDLHVLRSKPTGFVSQERTGDAPTGIVGRCGKGRFCQLCTGHLAHRSESSVSGNHRSGFMGPILAGIGYLGMQCFDALGLVRTLRVCQGLGKLSRHIGARQRLRKMRTGDLVRQSQINPYFRRGRWPVQVWHVTGQVHIPAASRILAEAASFDGADDWPRQPQPKPRATIDDRLSHQANPAGFEGNPGQGAFPAAPLQLAPAELALACDVFVRNRLHCLGMQAQVFRDTSRERVQVIGREKGFVSPPSKQADVLCVVPDEVHRLRHLEERLTSRRVFNSEPIRECCHGKSVQRSLYPLQPRNAA